MYLPLSFALLGGALSPSSLERCPYLPESLHLAIGRLRLLPTSLTDLEESIQGALSALGVPLRLHLPVDSPNISFDFDNRAAICRLRIHEMEYAPCLTYAESTGKPIELFYDALLRAEACWLCRSLAGRIEQLASAGKARRLLCEVLDEVYATGVRAGEAGRCGWHPGLCNLLRGALASLYLKLTIDFGHLLEPRDYLDYSMLLCDPCYAHSASPAEWQEYEIRRTGNRVRRLLSTGEQVDEAKARMLYEELVGQLLALPRELAGRPGLWREVAVLEGFLFCCYSHVAMDEGVPPYRLLSDPGWMARKQEELYASRYAAHQTMGEGRTAAIWLESKMREHCFSFLFANLPCSDSLPRLLYARLHRQLQVYEAHYNAVFTPVDEGGRLAIAATGLRVPDPVKIRKAIQALGDATNKKGEQLMSKESQNLLEVNILAFIRGGRPESLHPCRIKICGGRAEVFYGFIFHCCDTFKGEVKKYILFLHSIVDDIPSDTNLKKNRSRYLKAYDKFVEESLGGSFSLTAA